MTKISLHACFALMLVLFLTGCFNTLAQRWEVFDADRTAEIGVKTKDYIILPSGASLPSARDPKTVEKH